QQPPPQQQPPQQQPPPHDPRTNPPELWAGQSSSAVSEVPAAAHAETERAPVLLVLRDVVPEVGRVTVGPIQIQLGVHLGGTPITLHIATDHVRVQSDDGRIDKTVVWRLNREDLETYARRTNREIVSSDFPDRRGVIRVRGVNRVAWRLNREDLETYARRTNREIVSSDFPDRRGEPAATVSGTDAMDVDVPEVSPAPGSSRDPSGTGTGPRRQDRTAPNTARSGAGSTGNTQQGRAPQTSGWTGPRAPRRTDALTAEMRRTVPSSGAVNIRGQRIVVGERVGGKRVTIRMTTDRVEVLTSDGNVVATEQSSLSANDLKVLARKGRARVLLTQRQRASVDHAGIVPSDAQVSEADDHAPPAKRAATSTSADRKRKSTGTRQPRVEEDADNGDGFLEAFVKAAPLRNQSGRTRPVKVVRDRIAELLEADLDPDPGESQEVWPHLSAALQVEKLTPEQVVELIRDGRPMSSNLLAAATALAFDTALWIYPRSAVPYRFRARHPRPVRSTHLVHHELAPGVDLWVAAEPDLPALLRSRDIPFEETELPAIQAEVERVANRLPGHPVSHAAMVVFGRRFVEKIFTDAHHPVPTTQEILRALHELKPEMFTPGPFTEQDPGLADRVARIIHRNRERRLVREQARHAEDALAKHPDTRDSLIQQADVILLRELQAPPIRHPENSPAEEERLLLQEQMRWVIAGELGVKGEPAAVSLARRLGHRFDLRRASSWSDSQAGASVADRGSMDIDPGRGATARSEPVRSQSVRSQSVRSDSASVDMDNTRPLTHDQEKALEQAGFDPRAVDLEPEGVRQEFADALVVALQLTNRHGERRTATEIRERIADVLGQNQDARHWTDLDNFGQHKHLTREQIINRILNPTPGSRTDNILLRIGAATVFNTTIWVYPLSGDPVQFVSPDWTPQTSVHIVEVELESGRDHWVLAWQVDMTTLLRSRGMVKEGTDERTSATEEYRALTEVPTGNEFSHIAAILFGRRYVDPILDSLGEPRATTGEILFGLEALRPEAFAPGPYFRNQPPPVVGVPTQLADRIRAARLKRPAQSSSSSSSSGSSRMDVDSSRGSVSSSGAPREDRASSVRSYGRGASVQPDANISQERAADGVSQSQPGSNRHLESSVWPNLTDAQWAAIERDHLVAHNVQGDGDCFMSALIVSADLPFTQQQVRERLADTLEEHLNMSHSPLIAHLSATLEDLVRQRAITGPWDAVDQLRENTVWNNGRMTWQNTGDLAPALAAEAFQLNLRMYWATGRTMDFAPAYGAINPGEAVGLLHTNHDHPGAEHWVATKPAPAPISGGDLTSSRGIAGSDRSWSEDPVVFLRRLLDQAALQEPIDVDQAVATARSERATSIAISERRLQDTMDELINPDAFGPAESAGQTPRSVADTGHDHATQTSYDMTPSRGRHLRAFDEQRVSARQPLEEHFNVTFRDDNPGDGTQDSGDIAYIATEWEVKWILPVLLGELTAKQLASSSNRWLRTVERVLDAYERGNSPIATRDGRVIPRAQSGTVDPAHVLGPDAVKQGRALEISDDQLVAVLRKWWSAEGRVTRSTKNSLTVDLPDGGKYTTQPMRIVNSYVDENKVFVRPIPASPELRKLLEDDLGVKFPEDASTDERTPVPQVIPLPSQSQEPATDEDRRSSQSVSSRTWARAQSAFVPELNRVLAGQRELAASVAEISQARSSFGPLATPSVLDVAGRIQTMREQQRWQQRIEGARAVVTPLNRNQAAYLRAEALRILLAEGYVPPPLASASPEQRAAMQEIDNNVQMVVGAELARTNNEAAASTVAQELIERFNLR
ncbi:OTU domain-containing protein, partial [Kibdelosporangium philippinense]|uniref:OTU domain-containing protein n=2 Tax=Kibdelosporangium philippinense TaxID=211113 RepID=UPI0035ED3C8E